MVDKTIRAFTHSRCPKCWSMAEIGTVIRWHPANECAKQTPEHLHRYCAECNFNWMTKTHDDAAPDTAE